MADLLMPDGKESYAAAYSAQRVSERSTALTAASYLPHDNIESLITDADTILLWLRQDSGTPVDVPDSPEEGSDPLSGQEDPPVP